MRMELKRVRDGLAKQIKTDARLNKLNSYYIETVVSLVLSILDRRGLLSLGNKKDWQKVKSDK